MQLFHQNPQMTGNDMVENRFAVPLAVVPICMNPLEVQMWCLDGTALAKPQRHLHAPPPPAEQWEQGGAPALATGAWAGPQREGHQERFGSWLGSPLASPLPPTMAPLQPRYLGTICGVKVDFTNPGVTVRKSLASVLRVLR